MRTQYCTFQIAAGLLIGSMLLGSNAAAQDSIFFSRSADIGENNAWVVNEFSEGPYILDLNVKRFSNGAWTSCVAGADCSTNAGRLTWGKPVYAPADGFIKTCWRNFDDNPKPGEKLKRVTGEGGVTRRIFTAGNHVNIETADGNMILLAHLKKGSVPASLCPFNAEEADVSKNGQDYPAAAVIPEGQRPQVRRGQLIGYAGNSGNSSGPHVHIHMKPEQTDTTEGSAVPIPFVQGWAHDYSAGSNATEAGWYKLNRRTVSSSGGNTMIHPSPFLRRADASAGAITTVEPVFLSGNRAVTAIETGLHDLTLISWDLAGPGSLTRKGDVLEGHATNVKIVAHDSSHVVVALRDAVGNAKLILYHVGITGAFTRLDDLVSDKVHSLDVAVTSGADKKIVVAMRREVDSKLKLIVADLDFAGGPAKLKLLGSKLEQGTVSALSVTGASNFYGAAVAARTAENTLKVIPYKLSADGLTLTRGTDYQAGAVSTVFDITAIPKGVVTAMKDSAGQLRLIALETSAAGNIAGNTEQAPVGGQVSEVRVVRTPHASGGNLATLVRADNGELLVLGWTMTDRGANIRRSGSSEAGAASRIAAAASYYSQAGKEPRDMLLSAIKDADGNLKLINWEVNLNP